MTREAEKTEKYTATQKNNRKDTTESTDVKKNIVWVVEVE